MSLPAISPAVLITGGAKRIGAAITRAFARAGWHVVIHYGQSRAAAETLAASLPSAECVACDLADTAAAVAMVEALAARLPSLTLLVNSAALFDYDNAAALDPAIFAAAMAVNALAPSRMAQAFLAAPRGAGIARRIIHLTDMKLANPNPDFFSYTMAKHALAAASHMQAMAPSAHSQDRVYAIAPGAMLPSFDQRPEEHAISGRMNLLTRLTQPEEIADTALFLSEGWLASGTTVFVDSGQHLLSQPRDVLYLARAGAA